jgi:endonuclease/exonuclease/phosphatase family metal-dependent hydrolase
MMILIVVSASITLLHAQVKSLKIASWNVENLFDAVYDGTEYDEYIPGRHGWSRRMAEKKLLSTARVICDIDADVVALQEVENRHILKLLRKRLEEVGCTYRYGAITSDRKVPIHNALISRIPISSHRDIRITPFGRERSILEVTLDTDPRLRIFVNHWRSKSGPESARVLYAKTLKRRLERLPPQSEYILLGDFNSDILEYKKLKSGLNDTGGVTGINHILKSIGKDGRLVRYSDLKSSAKRLSHCSLWTQLPVSSRWSHNFYGKKEALDAILIPPTLADGRGWDYLEGSFGVFKPGYLFGRHGEIRRWEYRKGRHRGRGYSDHLPIYAVFTLHTNSLLDKIGAVFTRNETKSTQKVGSTHTTDIRTLLETAHRDLPLTLPRATVIFKRGDSAIVRHSPKSPALLLYRCASDLEEGKTYDLTIYRMKNYKGMKEAVDIEIARKRGGTDISGYITPFRISLLKGDRSVSLVTGPVVGVFDKGKIVIDGKRVNIFFKRGVRRPRNGSRIIVKRAQIGYYNGRKELVVWSSDDYETME